MGDETTDFDGNPARVTYAAQGTWHATEKGCVNVPGIWFVRTERV